MIPNILGREKERRLSRIATRGVVQLFNAVRQQQSSIEKQLKEKKLTTSKREKILKSIDRKAFMDALSSSANITLSKDDSDGPIKTEVKVSFIYFSLFWVTKFKIEKFFVQDYWLVVLFQEEDTDHEENHEKSSWEVLRNDFMMGAKLKDWDKKGEDEMSE